MTPELFVIVNGGGDGDSFYISVCFVVGFLVEGMRYWWNVKYFIYGKLLDS